MIAYFTLGCLLASFTSFIYAFLVFFQGIRRKLHLLCAAMAMSVGLWSLGLVLMVSAKDSQHAMVYLKYVHYIGGILIAPFFLHFILCFLNQEKKHRILLWTNYSFMSFLLIVNFLGKLATVIPKAPFRFYTHPEMFYFLFSLIFLIDVIYTHYLLYCEYSKTTGVKKEQIKYLLLGLSIGFLGGSTTFPLTFDVGLFPFGAPLVIAYVITATYSIVKHQLLDIRLAISRTLIFALVYIPILVIPIAITIVFKDILKTVLSDAFWLVPTVLEGALAVGGLFVYRGLQAKAESRLRKQEYQHEQAIKAVSHDLVCISEIEELAKIIGKRCKEAVGLESISIYIINPETKDYELKFQEGLYKRFGQHCVIPSNNPLIKHVFDEHRFLVYEELSDTMTTIAHELRALNGVVVIPSFRKDQLLGMIVLGEKKNKKVFTDIELSAFHLLANQFALAIENTTFLMDLRQMETELNEAQRMKEIGYLASAIGHEVGNGLQIIAVEVFDLMTSSVYLDQIKQDLEVEKEYMQVMDTIMQQISHLRKVNEELSTFIKRENPGTMANVALREIFDHVLTLVQVRNPGMKHMNITVEGNAVVWGNSVQLQTVFYNMLNNSYDAIKMEKAVQTDSSYLGSIQISIKEQEKDIHINIIDNGIGMNDSVKKQIFVPLFTTKASVERREQRLSGGMGIGMYTIWKILKAHKGLIEIISTEEHKGTHFCVILQKSPELALFAD